MGNPVAKNGEANNKYLQNYSQQLKLLIYDINVHFKNKFSKK